MGDDLSRVLETSQAERLATGFVFTEGPLWHPDGFYYFVDIRKSHLHRITPGKPAELVRADTGEGNGTTFDLQGRLVICEGGNRRVTRWSARGRLRISQRPGVLARRTHALRREHALDRVHPCARAGRERQRAATQNLRG